MIARELAIEDELSIFAVHTAVRDAAGEMGFDGQASEELVVAASELASNIVKHAQRGRFTVEEARHPAHGPAIQLTATDSGPAIADLALAIRDGYDDRGPVDPAHLRKGGGLGVGLGAVARFTHGLEIETNASGKRLIAIRYLNRPR